MIRKVFENEKSLKVGQNIKYDMIVLQNYGVEVKGPLFDSMVAHYVLQPNFVTEWTTAEIYLHYQTIHIEELIGPKGKEPKKHAATSIPKTSTDMLARMQMSH